MLAARSERTWPVLQPRAASLTTAPEQRMRLPEPWSVWHDRDLSCVGARLVQRREIRSLKIFGPKQNQRGGSDGRDVSILPFGPEIRKRLTCERIVSAADVNLVASAVKPFASC